MSAKEQSSTESAAFLQARVALFAKTMVMLTLVTSVLQFATDAAAGDVERVVNAMYGFYTVATVGLLALWLACRTGRRTERFVHNMEVAALMVNAIASAIGGRYLNDQLLPQFLVHVDRASLQGQVWSLVAAFIQHYVSVSMALAFALTMLLRAALVPSSAKRTFLLTTAIGLPLLVINGFGLVPLQADRALREAVDLEARWVITIVLFVWWAMTVAVATISSRVIYTLQKEVREARKLGQYELVEKLGEGGMGEVYRARHAMMRRPTAVKLLPPEKTGAASLARFEREVQLTAQLTHPNTITIFDYGRTPDGVFYYAMELLDGATLDHIVEQTGPMPPGRVKRILAMIAGALAEAHGVGLIHRDIKPSNIIVCERGGERDVVKVLDFGLVKDIKSKDAPAVTQEGAITGTPQYLAPESVQNPEGIDARADIYALGAVGYYLVTGHHVFHGTTALDLLARHMMEAPVPPSERLGREVPACLERMVMSCLEKEPRARPQSARALLDLLDGCDVEPWTSDDAASWWELHGEALRKPVNEEALVGVASTVTVDWMGVRRS